MAKRISETEAVQIMRNGGLEPIVPFKTNDSPWQSKCLICGLESSPSLKSIKNKASSRKGCRYCAPNAPISPEQARDLMMAANLEPLENFLGSASKWKCKCLKCQSIVYPSYSSIKRGQGGCLNCAGLLVNPAEAERLFIANDLQPLVPYPGAGSPWRSIHKLCGREVTPTYSNIRIGHSGCKYCIGNFVDGEKAKKVFLANGLLPLEPYKNALVGWKSIHQECGREVSPRYNTVQQGSSGCQYCAGNLPISEEVARNLFIENGLIPQEKFPGTQKSWKSIHKKCGKLVFPQYSSIQQGGGGCKHCAGNFIEPVNAIELFKSKGLDPIESYPGSSKPWKSIHKDCGRVVSPIYSSVQQGQGGCGYCAGNVVDPKIARLLFIERGLVPQEVFPGAGLPWRSIHTQCGREVFPMYKYILDGSSGCRECSVNYVNPELALEVFRSADLEPLEPYPGAGRGWRSIHTVCGKEVTPHWGYVRKYKAGCKYCAGKAITDNDANAFLRIKGFEPQVPYPGSQSPWLMIHKKCGMTVSPRLNSLQYALGDGSGCAKCADSSFNFLEPAIIYLITNSSLGAHKIGISGASKKRVEQHRREGWELYKTMLLNTGEQVYGIEQEIFEWLRDTFGLTTFLSKEQMPQGGYTETVDASEIDLPTIWAKVEELSKKRKKMIKN